MILAAKACWEVSAGLIPGQQMPEYFKRWVYTSDDYASDGGTQDGLLKPSSIYATQMHEVHTYANTLEAGGLNWVKVDYLWF